jgi:hypothetical protein
MNQRENLLQQLRQQIKAEVHLAKAEEQFQNEVLRPCIKTQSDVLMQFLKHTLTSLDPDFRQKDSVKRHLFIRQLLQKNNAFAKQCNGMIVGLFTREEFDTYLHFKNQTDKRIQSILLERFLSLEHTLWK